MGIVLYELTTGRLPFINDDPRMTLQDQLEKKPVAPSKIKAGVHPLVERIILKLLEKNPQHRYQSAKGLYDDLLEANKRIQQSISSPDLELDSGNDAKIQIGRVYVGRSEELEFLNSTFQKTFAEELQLCFISGFSGLGKTALLTELQNKVLIAGAHIAYGKCQASSRGLPFYSIGEAFNNFLAKLDSYPLNSQEVLKKRIVELVGTYSQDLLKIAPAFSKIFSDSGGGKANNDEKASQRIKEVIARVINAISHRGQPLLILIDDLQWADYSTIEFISFLIEQKSSAAVLFIGTYRPEEVDDEHPIKKLLAKYGNSIGVSQLTLQPLQDEVIKEMVSKTIVKNKSPLPEELYRFTIEHAKGNPFFVNEILRVLVGDKVISLRDGKVHWDDEKSHQVNLPTSLIDLVLNRLKGFADKERTLLGGAAVLGNPFSILDLAALVEDDPFDIDLILRRLLLDNTVKRIGDENFSFYHDKILEACQLILNQDRQMRFHRRAIEIIEKKPQDDKLIFSLAEHSIKSNEPERAFMYCLKSAEISRQKNSLNESLSYYQKALQFANSQAQNLVTIQSEMSDILIALGKYAEASVTLTELLQNTVITNIERVNITNKISECLQRQGNYNEALSKLNQSLHILNAELYDRNFSLGIFFDKAEIFLRQHFFKWTASTERSARLVAICNTLQKLWMVQVINNNKPLLHISYRFLKVATQLRQPKELATANQYLALTVSNVNKPNFKLGLFHAQKAVELGQQINAHEIVAGALIRMAAFLTWQAKSREAINYAERARETLLSVGNMWDLGNAIIFIYFSNKTLGVLPEALATAQSLVKLGERTGSNGLVSSGSSKAAEILFLLDKVQEAEKYLNSSIEIAEKFSLKFDHFQALKVAGFSRLHRSQYKEARQYFSKAIKYNEESGGAFFKAYIQEAYLGYVESYLKDKVLFLQMIKSESTEIATLLKYLHTAEKIEVNFREFGHVLRLKGIYFYRTGEFAKAKQAFVAAFQKFSEQERPLDLAIAELDWGILLNESSDGESQVFVKRAHKKFVDVGALQLVSAAEDVLRDLGQLSTFKESHDKKIDFEKVAKTLTEVSLVTFSSLDPVQQSRALLDKVNSLFQAERSLLFLLDKSGNLQFNLGRDSKGSDLVQPDSFSRTILTKVVTSKTTIVAANTEEGVLLGAHSVVAKNLLSMMAAPVMLGDLVLGVLYLDNRVENKFYRNEDGNFLQALTAHIGSILQITKLANLEIEKGNLQKDLELTAAVQKLLLPSENDFTADLMQMVSYYQPASISGGDWWWFNKDKPDHFQIFLGDVTGHGAGPAMITAAVAGTLRLLNKNNLNSNYDLLKSLNDQLYDLAKDEYWMTMNIVDIDLKTLIANLWFAAGTEVYIFNKNGEFNSFSELSSALGDQNGTFGNAQVQLTKGDRIVLSTDGIYEQPTESGQPIGERRWIKTIKQNLGFPLKTASENMIFSINELKGREAIVDDMCFIMVEIS